MGLLSGYFGGWLDSIISRVTDIFFGIPFLLGAMVVLNAFTERKVFVVILALAFLGWTSICRVTRSSVITAKQADYVTAARALGAGTNRMLFRHDAAALQEYEKAARDRDRLVSLRKAVERQQMVTEKPEDLDVIALAEDELEAAVQVFFVRRGRVMGRKGFIVDKVEDLNRAELVARDHRAALRRAAPGHPQARARPDEPAGREVIEEWLCHAAREPVEIRVPQRGDKRDLLETVERNAKDEFQRHRLKRASDHNARARALTSLQDALGLPEAPLRIECFDMSHIQGTDYVGSMVVMEDGLPRKTSTGSSRSRRSTATTTSPPWRSASAGGSRRYLAERDRPPGDRPGKFPTRPSCS